MIKQTIRVLTLLLAGAAVFVAGYYRGLCSRITPQTMKPLMKKATIEVLQRQAPELFGADLMNSMEVFVAGRYLVGFYPRTNASLFVVDAHSKHFVFFASDSRTNGVADRFDIVDLKGRRDFAFLDRDADSRLDMYSGGNSNVTLLDRDMDGRFDMKKTLDGNKWLLFNQEWHPYTMSNGAFCITIENNPVAVTFEDGQWIRRQAETKGSNNTPEDILR